MGSDDPRAESSPGGPPPTLAQQVVRACRVTVEHAEALLEELSREAVIAGLRCALEMVEDRAAWLRKWPELTRDGGEADEPPAAE